MTHGVQNDLELVRNHGADFLDFLNIVVEMPAEPAQSAAKSVILELVDKPVHRGRGRARE